MVHLCINIRLNFPRTYHKRCCHVELFLKPNRSFLIWPLKLQMNQNPSYTYNIIAVQLVPHEFVWSVQLKKNQIYIYICMAARSLMMKGWSEYAYFFLDQFICKFIWNLRTGSVTKSQNVSFPLWFSPRKINKREMENIL